MDDVPRKKRRLSLVADAHFLILETDNRAAAGFAEAALISMLKDAGALNDSHNINRAHNDPGGTGPRRTGPYWIYLAVRALHQ